MEKYSVRGEWTAESLALHTQAVVQGAFILAKAKSGVAPALDAVDHLRLPSIALQPSTTSVVSLKSLTEAVEAQKQILRSPPPNSAPKSKDHSLGTP